MTTDKDVLTAAHGPVSTFANPRSNSIPFGVDIDLTYGAFRLPTIYEKDDSKWSAHNQDPPGRVFLRPYDRADVPRSSKREHGKNKSRTIGTENGENVDPNDNARDAGAGDESESDEDEEAPVTGNYELIRQAIIGAAMEKYLSNIKSKLINFSDIVDIDDEEFEQRVTTDYVSRFIESNVFKMFMTVVILVNAIMIALETDATILLNYGRVLKVFDNIFLTLFLMEILMKLYAGFWEFWKSGWNVFDVLIVGSALLAPAITFISSARVLRVLRILRAFRALRRAQSLEGLRTVARTILMSIPDMFNIMMLLLLLMFIFSVLGVTLFKATAPEYFGDLSNTMFTLFILITQDGWIAIFEHMESRGLFNVAAPYFAIFITIGPLIFVNLIVAVVVANLSDSYDQLEKSRRARYRRLQGGDNNSAPVNRMVAELGTVVDEAWEKQIPYEVPNLNNISREKLNNYFSILTLMEQNMVDYSGMKAQLASIVEEVKECNTGVNEDANDEEDGDDADGLWSEFGSDAESGMGDPLSRMLMR